MLRKSISLIVVSAFIFSLVTPLSLAQAHSLLGLPEPGTMVLLSPAYEPALIKGLTVHQDNPFLFDFIVDTGHSRLAGDALKKEGDRLVKYFFAALTIPDRDIWVNLSPYEKDHTIPSSLGQTAMGRDLLAQDYMLKQLTASLIYPEKELGKNFWDKVYAQAREQFGTTDIPVNTFNKVWIVADKASVWEHGQTAFIVNSHLKVMLEKDYLAMAKNMKNPSSPDDISSKIIRSIILPALEEEVNHGRNFATLRQIFYSQILAVWFKRNLKQALLSRVYADQSTVNGVNLQDPSIKEKIYQRYLQAYKKGAFNYIKDEIDPVTRQSIPRKYFSGGYDLAQLVISPASDRAMRDLGPATGTDVLLTVALSLNQKSKPSTDPAMLTGLKATSVGRFILNSKAPVNFDRETGNLTIDEIVGRAVLTVAFNLESRSWEIKSIPLKDRTSQKPSPTHFLAMSWDGKKVLQYQESEGMSGRYSQTLELPMDPFINVEINRTAGGESAKIILLNLVEHSKFMNEFNSNSFASLNTKIVVNDAAMSAEHRPEEMSEPMRQAILRGEAGGWKNNIGQFMLRPLPGKGGSVGTYPNEDGAGFSKVVLDSLTAKVTVTYYPDNGNWIIKENYDGISIQTLTWNREKGILSDWADKTILLLARDPFIDLIITNLSVEIRLSRAVTDSSFSSKFNRSSAKLRIVPEMPQDSAMGSRQQEDWNKGGIDLGTLNNGLSVSRDAGGVAVAVDPAMVERIRREGITDATPVIINMRVLSSVNEFLRV